LKEKKITAEKKKLNFFGSKTTIYLSLSLHKERPSYRNALRSQKRPSNTSKHELLKKNSTSVGHFCPPGPGSSGSGSTDPIESGSATLPVVRHGLAALQHPLLSRLADELELLDTSLLVAELAVDALELLLGLRQEQLHVALPEMKFLDINSTKDSRSLLLCAIHSPLLLADFK
jgi:hypothetical protein